MVLVIILKDNSVKVFDKVSAVGVLLGDTSVLHVSFNDGHFNNFDVNKIFEWHVTTFTL